MYPCVSRVEQAEGGHAGCGNGQASWLLARAEDLVAQIYQGGKTFVLAMQLLHAAESGLKMNS
jgi:hypothetical protein